MPLILHLETTTEICSVCVSKGNTILSQESSPEHYVHASKITTLIKSCCAKAGISLDQLDAISLSSGPGSYTGLRIGSSTAKGICYALDKPLIAVDTLKALALATQNDLQKEEALYCPMIDARRMEVYTNLYNAKNEAISELQALIVDTNSFHSYFSVNQSIVFSGNGAPKCKEVLDSSFAIFHPMLCHATMLHPLALEKYHAQQFADIAYFSPSYFKAPNITQSKKSL